MCWVHLRVLRVGLEVVGRVCMCVREERVVVWLRAGCERVAWGLESERLMLGPGNQGLRLVWVDKTLTRGH